MSRVFGQSVGFLCSLAMLGAAVCGFAVIFPSRIDSFFGNTRKEFQANRSLQRENVARVSVSYRPVNDENLVTGNHLLDLFFGKKHSELGVVHRRKTIPSGWPS